MTEIIRDFIYLDEERLRSFSAQLLQGVPESSVSESDHEIGGAAKGEAGLLTFLKAQGELDYRYRRSASETRSLHHHVYTLFEQSLDDRGFLRSVDVLFDHTKWSMDTFVDGEFVRIRGSVQLVDHSRVLGRLRALPKFAKAAQSVASAATRSSSQGSKGPPRSRQASQQFGPMNSELNRLPLDQLASVGEQLYDANEFRMKTRPEGAPEGNIFAGQGKHEFLIDSSLILGGIHRSPRNTAWIVVGQIVASGDETEADPMPIGNQVEDGLEGLAAVLEGITRLGSGVTFPAIQIIPVAIYREIIARDS
jgi:hypothetical protein